MAIPTSYTEYTLAEYMHSLITHDDKVNELTSTMRWSVDTATYTEAVDEAIAACGAAAISSITGATNIRKLRAAARVELWKLVMQRTVPHHQKSDSQGTSISHNQVHEHAKALYEMFLAEATDIYGLFVDERPSRMGAVALERYVE